MPISLFVNFAILGRQAPPCSSRDVASFLQALAECSATFSGCEREPVGINRNKKSIDAFFNFDCTLDSGRIDRQRSYCRVVPNGSPSQSALKSNLRRHLKADEVLSQRCAVVCAAREPQAAQPGA